MAIAFILAAALLPGSLPAQAPADSTEAAGFEIVKYNNPGAVADLGVGLWAWPLPMDYDHDGDMDLVVSCPDKPFGGLYYFENASGEAVPLFEPPRRIGDALKDVQVSYIDGKPRVLVPGAEFMDFSNARPGEKKMLYPVDSILSDFKKKPRFNQWKLVDYGQDGDEDIIVGVDDWSDYGWDNAFNEKGKWTNGPLHGYVYLIENQDGNYRNQGRLEAGGKIIDVYGAPSPNFADFDGDGDLDLVCGEFLDRLTWFENTGSSERPVYAAGKYLRNSAGIIKMDLQMIIPVAVDWDKDGHIDLVVGDEDGRVALLRNTGQVKGSMPVWESPLYFQQKAGNLKFGALATPFSTDWDNDGDEDLVAGNSAGYIAFIENLDGGNPPRWAKPRLLKAAGSVIRIQAGTNGSIQGPAEAKWGYTTLSVADWDGDGLKDLLVNSIWGKVLWYRNTGPAARPRLAGAEAVKVDWGGREVPRPQWNWWDPGADALVSQWRTTPFATDWNKDGLADLVMLDHEGYLAFFERVKKDGKLVLTPGQRVFYGTGASGFNSRHAVTDSLPGPLRLNTEKYGRSGRVKFALADWDQDGLIDILVNSGNISFMKNLGKKNGKWFFSERGMIGVPVLAGHTTSPTMVDWNKDGVPELLAGAEDGHFYYLDPGSNK
ncbi:FG-GAP repeat domain-containing protein [Anseongella ginsenosidimutans]|nr:VCBS repeat-containing protein [Anseongella ginsenosidimutans]QEC54118.1 VCBS repeat-containing protein [Anseongella ginsenosidimutans]